MIQMQEFFAARVLEISDDFRINNLMENYSKGHLRLEAFEKTINLITLGSQPITYIISRSNIPFNHQKRLTKN